MAAPEKSLPDQLDQNERLSEAAKKRAHFLALVKQAKLKVEELPRELIAPLGYASASLMLVQVVTGKLEPRNAKEAMEVAKIALELARIEAGEGGMDPSKMTDAEREQLRADAAAVLERVRAEAAQIKEAEGGNLQAVPDDDEPSE